MYVSNERVECVHTRRDLGKEQMRICFEPEIPKIFMNYILNNTMIINITPYI